MDSEKLTMFPDNYFDVCISNICLNITEDSELLLKETKRVLKRGGKAIFSVWG